MSAHFGHARQDTPPISAAHPEPPRSAVKARVEGREGIYWCEGCQQHPLPSRPEGSGERAVTPGVSIDNGRATQYHRPFEFAHVKIPLVGD
jgi:hypothetical protein